MQQSIRRSTQDLIITLTDDDGADVVIDFSAIITATGFTRDVASYSQCSVNFRVTGDINFDTIITPPAPSEVFSIYLSTTPEASTVSDAALIGKEILMVAREGSVYNETTGTPTGRYFKFTSGTGLITFDSGIPFNTGEIVYVEYKT